MPLDPPAATTTVPGDSLRMQLAAAAAGVAFVTEGEAPFTVVSGVRDTRGGPLTPNDVRRLFGLGSGAAVWERSLDDFFSYGTAPDPADAASVAMATRVTALRELVRAVAPGARAFRIGDGAEVRYLVVGRTAHGEIVGLETVGYES